MRSVRSFVAAIVVLSSATGAPRVARAEIPDGPEAPRSPSMPRVHIESIDPNVILFRVPTPEERDQLGPSYRERGVPLCRAPCDQVIEAHDGPVFFVGRRSRMFGESERFRLAGAPEGVTLRVGDRDLYTGGAWLTAGGATSMSVSLALAIVSFGKWIGGSFPESLADQRARTHVANEYLWAAQGLLGGGLLLLVGGVTTMAAGKIQVERVPGVRKRPAGAVRFDGLVLRF